MLRRLYQQLTSLDARLEEINNMVPNNVEHDNLDPDNEATELVITRFHEVKSVPSTFSKKLKRISVYGIPAKNLPELPPNLMVLDIQKTEITSLPILPITLRKLICNDNNLMTLPKLSHLSSLEELNCGSNPLTFIPALPANLQTLICHNTHILLLPSLPTSLIRLDTSYTPIQELPSLPSNLEMLYCQNTRISTLSLPETIAQLSISTTFIKKLTRLPTQLKVLNAVNTDIESLPPLPEGFEALDISYSKIQKLEMLPKSIYSLVARRTDIGELPSLPEGLYKLDMSYSNLSRIESLPSSLKLLYINGTLLSRLPRLPEQIIEVHCEGVRLEEIPYIPANSLNGGIVLRNVSPLIYTEIYNAERGIKRLGARYEEQESKNRVQQRTALIKEELMAALYHPDRLEILAKKRNIEFIDLMDQDEIL